jgi:hypothetical protein
VAGVGREEVCGSASDLPPPPALPLPPTAHIATCSTAGAVSVGHSTVNTANSAVATSPTTVPGPVPAAAGVCDVDVEKEMEALKKTVSAINRLRPRFVVVTGSFTHAYPTSALSPSLPKPSPSSTTPSSSCSQAGNIVHHADLGSDSLRDRQLNQFMRTMARVSETIPLLFVPGDRDVGKIQTPQCCAVV